MSEVLTVRWQLGCGRTRDLDLSRWPTFTAQHVFHLADGSLLVERADNVIRLECPAPIEDGSHAEAG